MPQPTESASRLQSELARLGTEIDAKRDRYDAVEAEKKAAFDKQQQLAEAALAHLKAAEAALGAHDSPAYSEGFEEFTRKFESARAALARWEQLSEDARRLDDDLHELERRRMSLLERMAR